MDLEMLSNELYSSMATAIDDTLDRIYSKDILECLVESEGIENIVSDLNEIANEMELKVELCNIKDDEDDEDDAWSTADIKD